MEQNTNIKSYSEMSIEELRKELNNIPADVDETNVESTDTSNNVETQQPTSTEVNTGNKRLTKAEFDAIQPGEYIPGTLGLRKPRPGIKGFFQDFGQGLYENMAPVVGISDTLIDLSLIHI